MMDNYFRCNQLSIVPCEGCVWAIGNFCQSFEQISGLVGGAGKSPEMWRPLERDADHVLCVRAQLGMLVRWIDRAGLGWFFA